MPIARGARDPGSPACRPDDRAAVSHTSFARRAAVLRGAACVLALLAAPSGLLADLIELKDGRMIAGEDCRPRGSEVLCHRAGGTIGFPKDQVVRIHRSRRPIVQIPDLPAEPDPATPPLLKEAPSPPDMDDEGAILRKIEALRAEATRDEASRLTTSRIIAELFTWLGNRNVEAGDTELAVQHYRSAIDSDPASRIARTNLAATLLLLWRNAEAGSILLGLLADEPDDPHAMLLMGEVRFREGMMEEAIALWERARTHAPSPAIEAELAGRLAGARRLMAAEAGFERSDSAHFFLKYDGEEASPDLAREILAWLDATFDQLSVRMAHVPDRSIGVVLYPRRSFKEATASPDWVGGLFDGQVRIPIGGLTSLDPSIRRVLTHELAHAFITSKTRGNAPRWIQEGYAQVIEGRSAMDLRRALSQAFHILGGVAAASEFTYPKSLSQLEFFLETWSESHFLDLLDHLGSGTDIETSLRSVTGLGEMEFLSAWGAWLEQ